MTWKFHQEQAILLTNVGYLETSFVKIASMNDDLFSLAARRGNGHHGFEGNWAWAMAREFDPHRVPPVGVVVSA